jgi:hypothetical protein
MHYIIQENVFREQHYDMLEKAIDKLGLKHTTVRVFPFVDKIVRLQDIPDGSFNVDEFTYLSKRNTLSPISNSSIINPRPNIGLQLPPNLLSR